MFETASKKLGLATAVLGTESAYCNLIALIYRYLCAGKREAAEVVEGGDAQKELDAKELHQLLRFGAYQLFNTDATAEQATDKRIMDESLDSILARASRVQYIDAGTGADVRLAFSSFFFFCVSTRILSDVILTARFARVLGFRLQRQRSMRSLRK